MSNYESDDYVDSEVSVLSTTEFNRLVDNGERALREMKCTKFDQYKGFQSSWKNPAALDAASWGFEDDPEMFKSSDFKTRDAFRELGVPKHAAMWNNTTTGATNRQVYCFKQHYFQRPGTTKKEYHKVGWYRNVFNPKNRFILAWENVSPAAFRDYLAYEGENLSKLPQQPEFWSDVAFLWWKKLCAMQQRGPPNPSQPPVKAPKFILRMAVVSTEVKMLVEEIMKLDYNKELPSYRRRGVFQTCTSEGKALLGTKNGLASARFLSQHKADLGHKYIDEIHVWFDEDYEVKPKLQFMFLYFNVKDV